MAALDIISNGLNVIVTGQRAKKPSVVFPTNKTLTSIVKLLEQKKYIVAFEGLTSLEAKKSKQKAAVGGALFSKPGELAPSKADTAAQKGNKNYLFVRLKYSYAGIPAIQEITLHSKPSCRLYYKSQEIPRMKNGYATAIITTSAGIMTGKSAREKRLGGELLCSVF